MTETVGVIGLGIMGRPMALNLIKGGHELFVHDKYTMPQDVPAAGATVCDGSKSVAERSEIIIVMVPDTPDVKAVLFDPGGVAEGLSPGKLVVDMSSISPIETKEFAAEINKLGCDYLDAPVARVSGKDVPMPYAANLEKLALPSAAEVVEAAKAVCYR